MSPAHFNRLGFTLIELLLVTAIIAVLAVSVFAALDPARRIDEAQNARRSTDVDTILTAIHQSIVDNKGSYPTNMPAVGTEAQLGTDVTGCAIATGGCAVTQASCVDLMANVAQDLIPFLKSMPIDPTGSPTYTSGKTGYSVLRDSNGIVTVKSCGAERGAAIDASR